MAKSDQAAFAEVFVDRIIVESFPEEKSAYYQPTADADMQSWIECLRGRVIWHINHSLSKRQKEVLKLYLLGKKEEEIGKILGVKQQVVNIYKHRAIKRLRILLTG